MPAKLPGIFIEKNLYKRVKFLSSRGPKGTRTILILSAFLSAREKSLVGLRHSFTRFSLRILGAFAAWREIMVFLQ